MVKSPITPKSRCYPTLWCIVNHNSLRFRLLLFFWH